MTDTQYLYPTTKDFQTADYLLERLVGHMHKNWWVTPNRFSDNKTPLEMWSEDKERVKKYIVGCCFQ